MTTSKPRRTRPGSIGSQPPHRSPESTEIAPGLGQPAIGQKLAAARLSHGWTLSTLAKLSGVGIATLSKVENGKSGASFDTIYRVSKALSLRFDDLLEPGQPHFASGRRSITRAGEGIQVGFAHYDYSIPCNDLTSKAMIPLIMTIKAREILPRESWASHAGEEYIYVVRGAIELHTEHYEPVRLQVGDSAYIDSQMKHAFVSVGDGDCQLISVCLADSLDALFTQRNE